MQRQNLDQKWVYKKAPNSWSSQENQKGILVDLPYDSSIGMERDPNTLAGASNAFFPGDSAVYEKRLFIPADWKDKKVILEFEGVYMNTTVRFNQQIVAQHPYGYTSFHCDLTPYILYGMENLISVTANNGALPNTRWYSGSGIYRHVWLLSGESLHIIPWGVSAVTPKVSPEESTVIVKTTVENNDTEAAVVLVRSTLYTANGIKAVSSESDIEIPAGAKSEFLQTLILISTDIWSVERPSLYTLKSEIVKHGSIIDFTETKIGIRSISFDTKNGFQLNGISMKLKGGCVHHDCGLLGAASYDRAEERKVELLKASGFNSVRCAHNPPSPAFLDACDKLGMLVINEAFDCWREGKNPNDYSLYFEDWWQRDLDSMIYRDRNHPSVIMWSIGNEIWERDGRSEGYKYSRKLADYVRSLDNTRPVSSALCIFWGNDQMVFAKAADPEISDLDSDTWGKMTALFAKPLDIVGYNYLLNRYENDGEKYPERIICGTETFPKEAFDCWSAVEKLPYVIGDFVWTGLDYLGEAGLGHVWYNGEESLLGKYPWHQAFCGDIDICGFKRPQSYYRDCVWGVSTEPYIAVYNPEYFGIPQKISEWGWPDVASSWTYPGFENKPVVVDVYCSNSEVELIINGKSLGRKPAGKKNRYTTNFELYYEPGEITAVGLENGIEVSRTTLKTAGTPLSLRLTPDRAILRAEFGDLSYILVEIIDAEGNIVHNACNNIYFNVSGVGSLIAVGSGNPVTSEKYVGNQRKVHQGRAMVVVRGNGEAGNINLNAFADGIQPENLIICVKKSRS